MGEVLRGGYQMTEAAREARREYKKAWYRANADRVKKYQEDYWNRRAEKLAAQEAQGLKDYAAEQ